MGTSSTGWEIIYYKRKTASGMHMQDDHRETEATPITTTEDLSIMPTMQQNLIEHQHT